jgi:predicted SnoaL-like aldol condensation-catalyzing enzyme
MTEQTNKAVFRRYLQAFNDGDLDAFDALVAPHYVNHNPTLPDPAPGPDGLKPIVRDLREQAPDLRFEEVQLVAEGALVAAHLLVYGFGPDPVQQIQIERFEDGRIVEHWRATGACTSGRRSEPPAHAASSSGLRSWSRPAPPITCRGATTRSRGPSARDRTAHDPGAELTIRRGPTSPGREGLREPARTASDSHTTGPTSACRATPAGARSLPSAVGVATAGRDGVLARRPYLCSAPASSA